MTFKKTLCTVLAALAITSVAFTSCGDSSSDTKDSKGNSAVEAQAQTTSVTEIANKLKDEIAFVDSLNELAPEMVEKILGVKQDLYTQGKVYVGSGGATAEEIACFEANDADSADAIKAALEKRVEAQKVAFENYQPAEMEKLNAPVIVVKDNCVYMCISDENSKAEEIIG